MAITCSFVIFVYVMPKSALIICYLNGAFDALVSFESKKKAHNPLEPQSSADLKASKASGRCMRRSLSCCGSLKSFSRHQHSHFQLLYLPRMTQRARPLSKHLLSHCKSHCFYLRFAGNIHPSSEMKPIGPGNHDNHRQFGVFASPFILKLSLLRMKDIFFC